MTDRTNGEMIRSTSDADAEMFDDGPVPEARRPSQPNVGQTVNPLGSAPLAKFREYGSTSSIDIASRSAGVASRQSSRDEFEQVIHKLKSKTTGKPPLHSVCRNTGYGRPSGAHELYYQHIMGVNLGPSNYEKTSTFNAYRRPKKVRDSAYLAGSALLPSFKYPMTKQQGEKSKTLRSKSVATEASILKKLIGRGSESPQCSSADGGFSARGIEATYSTEFKEEERTRKKVFAHFDCQSIISQTDNIILAATTRNRNVADGVSFATGAGLISQDSEEDFDGLRIEVGHDAGDGRTNKLVQSTPNFRNEIGTEQIRNISLSRCFPLDVPIVQSLLDRSVSGNIDALRQECSVKTWLRSPLAAEASVLENLADIYLGGRLCARRLEQMVIEHTDQGAFYYRYCFAGTAHQNFVGSDDLLGPVAVSVMRDRLPKHEADRAGLTTPFFYRIIIRHSDLTAIRGSILEESLPSYQQYLSDLSVTNGATGTGSQTPDAQSHSNYGDNTTRSKLPVRELIEMSLPELNSSSLKLALPVPRTEELLLKLDEQGINIRYKIGVLYQRYGQQTEEDMYNNEHAGPAFDEFLDMLGTRVRLKAFDGYKGGLDTRGDTTGQYSLHTAFQQFEIMFHVSTMLPFTSNNKQQICRKRHIGNDIVTVVFQEPGALPFSPQTIRSHFQHVFIVVRVYNPNTDKVRYSVSISRNNAVPSFGPYLPPGAIFPKSKDFRDFLLTKIINADNAVFRSQKFISMASRTRREFIRDLLEHHSTNVGICDQNSKRGKLISSKRRDRCHAKVILAPCVKGAIVWNVTALDCSQQSTFPGLLGISGDSTVIVERRSKQVVFATSNLSIIGWDAHGPSIKLYFDHADMIVFWLDEAEVTEELLERWRCVTNGCATSELLLRRTNNRFDFHVQHEGIVSDVEMYGQAWQAGLRQGSRIVEVSNSPISMLEVDKVVELLETMEEPVRVMVIPQLEDGSPRRGCEDPFCPSVTQHESSSSGSEGFITARNATRHQYSSHKLEHDNSLQRDDSLSLLSDKDPLLNLGCDNCSLQFAALQKVADQHKSKLDEMETRCNLLTLQLKKERESNHVMRQHLDTLLSKGTCVDETHKDDEYV